MGAVSSCCLPPPKDAPDDERVHILEQPATIANEAPVRSAQRYGSVASGDLNSALHRMASAVIDVSALDVPSLEHAEWLERRQTYAARAKEMRFPTVKTRSGRAPVLGDALADDDLQLARVAADKTLVAVRGGFAVRASEAFVVAFEPAPQR